MAGGAAAATTGRGLMKLLAGGREACLVDFGGSSAAMDIYVLCHEVRGMDLSPGEQLSVSLRDLTRSDPEKETMPGRPWELRQVRSEAVLQLRAWASSSPDSRRHLGELRLPIAQLRALGLNMLYQTWITLDPDPEMPGSQGLGLSDLEQKMNDGSRQLFQPKVCLSLCKAEDVTDGKMTLGFDISNDLKDERWSALLRSQMQHVTMSHGLHLQGLKAQRNGASSRYGDSAAASQIQDAIGRVQSQALKIQDLKHQLRSRPGLASSDQSSRVSSGQDALQRAQLAEAEAQKCRESNEALKAEVAQMRASLDKVAVEANGKIDAANERIRTLRKERDDALKEGDGLRAGGERLLSRQEECRRAARFGRTEGSFAENCRGLAPDLQECWHDQCGAPLHPGHRRPHRQLPGLTLFVEPPSPMVSHGLPWIQGKGFMHHKSGKSWTQLVA